MVIINKHTVERVKSISQNAESQRVESIIKALEPQLEDLLETIIRIHESPSSDEAEDKENKDRLTQYVFLFQDIEFSQMLSYYTSHCSYDDDGYTEVNLNFQFIRGMLLGIKVKKNDTED